MCEFMLVSILLSNGVNSKAGLLLGTTRVNRKKKHLKDSNILQKHVFLLVYRF